MPIKNCIFCNCVLRPSQQNQPDSQTAEHIFAEWFRKLSLHRVINMYVGNVNGEIPEFRYRPTLTSLTMKGVCKKCNEGWMSTLETAVDSIIRWVLSLPTADLGMFARSDFVTDPRSY